MANQGCLGFLFSLLGINGQSTATSLPYRIRDDAILTDEELEFYKALRTAVGSTYIICPKVNLGDIFKTEPYSQAARNQISQKHVDFLLCDPQTMSPVAGIELNDSSHERADRVARDELVSSIFNTCSLPLYPFPARRPYDPRQISATLQKGSAPQLTYETAAPKGRSNDPVAPTPIVGRNTRR